MYVKRILLRNFKSFPKATLELDKSFSAVVGPNGSGKCVRGDTKVLLSDGSLVPIASLVESALLEDSHSIDDGWCSLASSGRTHVLSLNLTSLKLEERPVTAFVKRKSPTTLYEITTQSGRRVVATSYHPVLTVSDGAVNAVSVERLNPGTWVALPRTLNVCSTEFCPLLELVKLDLPVYVACPSDFVDALRSKKHAKGLTWKKVALSSGAPLATLKGLLAGQTIRLCYAYRLALFLGYSDYEFTRLFFRVKAKNHHIFTTVPIDLSADLARFLGLVISEGRVVKNEVFFFSQSEVLLQDFVDLSSRLFGIRPSVKTYSRGKMAILPSAVLVILLERIFSLKRFGGASTKNIPACLFRAPLNAVVAFISGLFDGDGYVSDPLFAKSELEYSSASQALVSDLSYLFLRLGLVARLRSSWKSATNTINKTRRRYFSLFLYGANVRLFAEKVGLREPLRAKRLQNWLEKTVALNPNVDLIPGLNGCIRTALKANGYGVRRLKNLKNLRPSRIRAYYENRCLPSRDGLAAVCQLIDDRLLETFAHSDIFWDQVRSVTSVPGEEWVYDLCVDGHHNFVAEGLFVHNSNVIDALMFSFGEMHLKSLRVKSTKDLIFKQHNVAEAAVVLAEDRAVDFSIQEVEEKGKKKRIFPPGVHEVRRLVRKDGKTKYLLNGRRVKKYVIDDFLAKHNISLYHVIKQGEVQRIVEMNSKDRRALIDFVSNVAEYEEKKKEAFLELGKVDEKLKEAQTVFSEREAYLRELEEDKKNAERFLLLEQTLKRASATLLHLDVRAFEKDFERLIAEGVSNTTKWEMLAARLKEAEQRIDQSHAKKDELNKTIAEKSQGREMALQKETDALQARIDQAKSLIEDRKTFVKKHEDRKRAAALDRQKISDEVKGFERQKASLEKDVLEIKKMLEQEQEALDKLLNQAELFSQQFFLARKMMEQTTEEMAHCKDQLNALQAEVAKQQELMRLKNEELLRLKKGVFSDFSDSIERLESEKKSLQEQVAPVERLLQKLFEEEKELNQRLPVLEDLLLDLREKMTTCEAKLRSFSDSSSKALEAVLAFREKEKGIYGTVGELVRYPSQYAIPVSVALGNRLQYVVVDSVKTAGKAIAYLKSHDLGRVSFIPLDKIHSPPPEAALTKRKGVVDYVLDIMEFDKAYHKAIAFACGNTLIVKDFESAETLVNQGRLVTLAGELFEPSGLVTGGKVKEKIDVFAEHAKLKEYEEKFEKTKKEKDALTQRLYSLRDQMSLERKRKAEFEVKLKRVELEHEHLLAEEQAVKEKQKDLHKAIALLSKEIQDGEKAVLEADEKRSEWIRKLSTLNVQYLEAKQKVDVEKEQHFGNLVKEKEHKVSELKITLVRLENEVRAAENQRTAYARQLAGVERDAAMLLKDVDEAEEAIRQADAAIQADLKALRAKVEEQKSVSKELRAWIEQREELEKQIAKAANEKGKIQLELDKLSSVKQDAELKRVAVETRLADVKAQFAEYEGVEVYSNKTDKAELLILKKQTEEELRAMGQINLRAVELYDQKKQEFEKQRVRVDQLLNEKNAVLALIQEIESRKISTFMNTFNEINSAFKKLFKTIFQGEGTLFLENSDNPFEGGLTIQVQLENKEIKYLELMSGGEKSLIALLFLFAIQSYRPSSIYILDEADAALDQENSRKLGLLLKQLAKQSQFLVVSHNETFYKYADCLVGVAMSKEGSQLVGVKLSELAV